jgi:hypothetical protein
MSADEPFVGVCFAIGLQSALGTVNSDIAGLTTPIDETDGCVLGVRDAGDAESGITLPTLARVGREKALLASFTPQPSTYLRTDISGLDITIEMKGNGAASGAPDAGAAKPLDGTATDECVHALWTCAGFTGANGVAPVYEYDPSASPTYATIKLFAGDQSWVFMDALADVTIDLVAGEIGTATFAFSIGSLNAQADGVTFPTVTYGTQTSLSAPTVQGTSTHTWDVARGFNSYSLSIANSIEKVPDSNQTTGERVIQTGREITLDLTAWIDTADTDFEYDELVAEVISTTANTVQVGTAAGAAATINAYKIEMLTPEVTSLKYNRLGTDLVVEATLKAVAATAGEEFRLTFN